MDVWRKKVRTWLVGEIKDLEETYERTLDDRIGGMAGAYRKCLEILEVE